MTWLSTGELYWSPRGEDSERLFNPVRAAGVSTPEKISQLENRTNLLIILYGISTETGPTGGESRLHKGG